MELSHSHSLYNEEENVESVNSRNQWRLGNVGKSCESSQLMTEVKDGTFFTA